MEWALSQPGQVLDRKPGEKHQTNDGPSSLPCQNALSLEGVRRTLLPEHHLPQTLVVPLAALLLQEEFARNPASAPSEVVLLRQTQTTLCCKESPQLSVA